MLKMKETVTFKFQFEKITFPLPAQTSANLCIHKHLACSSQGKVCILCSERKILVVVYNLNSYKHRLVLILKNNEHIISTSNKRDLFLKIFESCDEMCVLYQHRLVLIVY